MRMFVLYVKLYIVYRQQVQNSVYIYNYIYIMGFGLSQKEGPESQGLHISLFPPSKLL